MKKVSRLALIVITLVFFYGISFVFNFNESSHLLYAYDFVGSVDSQNRWTEAGGPPSLPRVQTVKTMKTGLNDMLQQTSAMPVGARSGLPNQSDALKPQQASGLSLHKRLSAWNDQTRGNTRLQLELPSDVSNKIVALARNAETLWNGDRYDEAIHQIQQIEDGGVSLAMGVNWLSPQPLPRKSAGANVRIGTRTGGVTTKLDYDITSKKYFAVVRWDTDNGWALHMSGDKGATWSEVYFWFAGASEHALSVDMAVVGDYVYIGYVQSNYPSEARIRRNLVTTGASDTVYGYKVALNASPATISQVAVESNADSFQNRIFCAVQQSDNAIRFVWANSTVGTAFTEASPSGVSSTGGIDLHWNYGYSNYYLWMSYIGTDSKVHVLGMNASGWTESTSTTFDGSHTRTSISAWDDHVICAHELQMTNGQGIRYFISHNGGSTWDYHNYIAEPASGEGPYQMADITARGGAGTAILFTHETGEPDDVIVRYRRGYSPGLWSDPVRVNSLDVSTGTSTALNWTPQDAAELSYGLIYFNGTTPYFNRFQADDVSSLYADFTGLGLYKWNLATWSKITADIPATMAASRTDLYASFTGLGIYKYNGTAWSRISTSIPTMMTASSTILYASFTGLGIYKYSGTTWSKITADIPATMTASGTDLYASFSGLGIYKYNGTAWSRISTSIPTMMTASGTILYANFTGLGIYKYSGTTWSRILTSIPAIMAGASTDLYASFTGLGIYKYSGTTWSRISTSIPAIMATSGTYLYASFTGLGIYKYNGSAWSRISTSIPVGMTGLR